MSPEHEDALAAFERRARARNLSPGTIADYRKVASRFLEDLGPKPLAEVAAEDVRAYLARRAATVRHLRYEVSRLRAFFQAVFPDGPLPTDGIKAKILPSRPPVVLSPEGVRKLFVVALDAEARGRGFRAKRLAFALRDRAMLELLYGVGLRCSEVAAVKLMDLDVGGGTLLVRRAKRGPSRYVPLPPSSLPHLARYVREGRPALVSEKNDDEGALLLSLRGKPLGTVDIYKLVEKLAGIARVRAHPHAFRRAVATHLVREGASVPAVKELLGHAELSTTAGYVAVDFEDLRRAVETLERPVGGAPEREGGSCST